MSNKRDRLNAIDSPQAVKSSLTSFSRTLVTFHSCPLLSGSEDLIYFPLHSINGSIMVNEATVWRAYIAQLPQCNLNNAAFESIHGCDAVVRQWNLWTHSRFWFFFSPRSLPALELTYSQLKSKRIYLVLKSAAVMQRLWLTTSPVIIMLHSQVLGFRVHRKLLLILRGYTYS